MLHEDVCNTDTTLRYKDLRLHFKHYSMQEYNSGFMAYTRHVRQYSTRSLIFRSDVYAAFSGIMNTLLGSAALYHGLPLAHFDRALHWFRMIDSKSLVREDHGVAFPSWSWYAHMSPQDEIVHQTNRHHGALTAWYAFDVINDEVLASNQQTDTDLDKDWRLLMALAYNEAGIAVGWVLHWHRRGEMTCMQ
jgi:hypothetical protein